MPEPILTGIGVGSSIIGGLGALFGDDGQDELRRALNKFRQLSQTGIDPVTLARLRTSRSDLIANEIAGQRAGASSRAQRMGIPYQTREQILADITQKGLLTRMSGLAEVDLMNEQMRFNALQAYMQGASQLKGTGEGFAQLFGSGLNLLGQLYGNQQPEAPISESEDRYYNYMDY